MKGKAAADMKVIVDAAGDEPAFDYRWFPSLPFY
jgi:hypothetical protein